MSAWLARAGRFRDAYVAVALCFLLPISHASAQGKRLKIPLSDGGENSRYVTIPFQGDVEELFKDRLRVAKDLEPLRKLVDDARANPGKYNVDPALLDRVDLSNPVFRAIVQRWRDAQAPGTPLTLDSLKNIYGDLKRWTKGIDLEKLDLPEANFSGPSTGSGQWTPEPEAWDADRLNRMLEEWIGDLDQYELSEWLRDSPAFQEGIGDLRKLLQFDRDRSAWNLDGLPAHLRLPDNLNLRLGEGALSGLRNLSLPALPRIELPRVRLGWGRFPSVSLPRWGGPGGVSNMSDALFWALGIGVIVAMLWIIIRRLGPIRRVASPVAVLGPWPVDPAAVATRRELVQAFDYLSLLRLGFEVRTWNHRAIAKEWLAATHDSQSVEELTRIYELARYTSGDDVLPDADRDAARRLLTHLRGRA